MEYKLCYVRGNKAWFTDNMEEQWGDDWDDKPYECNAGVPYDDWGELIEDNEDIFNEDIFKRKYKYHEIKHKRLYFETNDWSEKGPYNGTWSVEEINKGKVPWVETDKYKIYAGTSYEDFIKVIEENGGKVYVEKE